MRDFRLPGNFRLSLVLLALSLLTYSAGCSRDQPRQAAPLDASATAGGTLPVTTITNVCPQYIVAASHFLKVRWSAEDPTSPDSLPEFFEWKLIPVPFAVSISDPNYTVLVTPGPQYPWIRAERDRPAVDLFLTPPNDYVFAVRSIGAEADTESVFSLNRNTLLIASLQSNAGPELEISEPLLGTVLISHDGASYEFDVAERCLRFTFRAITSQYCGEPEQYNYGVDVASPENDGPGSGFKGWSEKPFTEPLCLTPGNHILTVKARDDMGGMVTGSIILRVTALPRDREVLYVDDYRLAVGGGVITDALIDGRMNGMLQAAGYLPEQIHQFDTFGANDLQAAPSVPSLAVLGRYKLVVWLTRAAGYNANPGLLQVTACQAQRNVLREYLNGGGALWIAGEQVFGATKKVAGGECKAIVGYDETNGLNFASPEFICDMLKLCGGDIRTVKTSPQTNGLERANPTAVAASELFPRAEVDSALFNVAGLGGIPYVDAAFDLDPQPGLSVLYTADANLPTSSFNGKAIGFRYFDPDQASRGPLFVFGFPLHLLKNGSAVDRTGTHGMARAIVEFVQNHPTPASASVGTTGVTP